MVTNYSSILLFYHRKFKQFSKDSFSHLIPYRRWQTCLIGFKERKIYNLSNFSLGTNAMDTTSNHSSKPCCFSTYVYSCMEYKHKLMTIHAMNPYIYVYILIGIEN